jgi:hypothetical protein
VVVKVGPVAVEILADLRAYSPRVEKQGRNENLPILLSLDEEDLDLELLVHNYNWSESKVTLQ